MENKYDRRAITKYQLLTYPIRPYLPLPKSPYLQTHTHSLLPTPTLPINLRKHSRNLPRHPLKPLPPHNPLTTRKSTRMPHLPLSLQIQTTTPRQQFLQQPKRRADMTPTNGVTVARIPTRPDVRGQREGGHSRGIRQSSEGLGAPGDDLDAAGEEVLAASGGLEFEGLRSSSLGIEAHGVRELIELEGPVVQLAGLLRRKIARVGRERLVHVGEPGAGGLVAGLEDRELLGALGEGALGVCDVRGGFCELGGEVWEEGGEDVYLGGEVGL